MLIHRKQENELLRLVNHFPVVAIIGPRQVGKTTLAKSVMNKLSKDSLYLDMESPIDLNKLREPELFLSMHQDKTIILDEIQRIPDLFNVIRVVVDQKRQSGRFIILGSATPELLRQSSESLAGRIAYMELTPLLWSELPEKDIFRHWLYGGYPQPVLTKEPTIIRIWQENFIRTYIERDLAILGLNIESSRLQKLLLLLAGFNGMPVNKSTLAKSLQISVPTVSRYIDFLEGAYLLRSLETYSTNLRKRVTKSPKYYFRDSGILHAVLGIHDMENLLGYEHAESSWEGYIIQQLIGAFTGKWDYNYFQTPTGAEIDLIISKGGMPKACIEVKFSEKPELRRGNLDAFEVVGAPLNLIVAPVKGIYPYNSKIEVADLENALMKLDGLLK